MPPEAALPAFLRPEPLVEGPLDAASLDRQVLSLTEARPTRLWLGALGAAAACFLLELALIGWTVYEGIGSWGNDRPVMWAFGIINFVFWIGIGHAGTLISAILLLFRQRWRNAISRFAEAMTIFAVLTAAVFPVLHLGRPWVSFWLAPYPNQRGLWPNFRSPLMWDVFAVSTYFSVSVLFWYVGLVPDLASMRDRARSPARRLVLNLLCLGWRGSASHWRHHQKAYTLLAGLATGLVLSVHSVVSFDFAVSLVPGWHMTIFPPYFVVGAVFSGFAMVVLVMLGVRRFMGLGNVVTMRHLELCNKLILTCSCLMGYAYMMEGFTAWYSMDPCIHFAFLQYIVGTYGWAGCAAIAFNVLVPQIFWSKAARRSVAIMAPVCLCVLAGMWFERFVIIVSSLNKDFLPSSWHLYKPTLVDVGILLGSFGMFFTFVLLFAKLLPVISTHEVKEQLKEINRA